MSKLKKCTICLEDKDLSKFEKYSKWNSYSTYCKKCKNKMKQTKRDKNPQKEALRSRKRLLMRKYKLTLEDYNNMYNNQQGRCKICGIFYEKLGVDHCHETNIIRGLLCHNCNSGLGQFKDNSGLLGRAILYLKETNTDKSK